MPPPWRAAEYGLLLVPDGEVGDGIEERGIADEGRMPLPPRGRRPPAPTAATARPRSAAETNELAPKVERCGMADVGLLKEEAPSPRSIA